MNINIPTDSRAWLLGPRPAGPDEGAVWSLGRYRPKCEVGDELVFRFDKAPVARARVHLICEPGEHDGVAHHGLRTLTGWKVVWLWSSFEDLRGRPHAVAAILAADRAKRRKT